MWLAQAWAVKVVLCEVHYGEDLAIMLKENLVVLKHMGVLKVSLFHINR
jgi:hypothetical protein